jgi:outer membrane protein TolC
MKRRAILLVCWMCCCAWAQMLPAGGQASSRAAVPPLAGPAGSTAAQQSSAPGSGINTVTSNVEVTGEYQGSIPSRALPPGPITLTLAEAIKLGLAANLGTITADNSVRAMRAERLQALSALLPNISANASDTVAQVNLAAYGFQFKLPPGLNFSIPTVVGPFNYSQLQATLSQSIYDPVSRRNWQASKENERASVLSAKNARELVVLAVAGMYMQTVAEQESLASQRAQVANAQAVYDQAVVRKQAGTNARIDVMRSLVELDMQKQRLRSMESEWQKQKIAFARLIGLPLDRELILSQPLSFDKQAIPDTDAAIQQALASRPDLQAAQAQVRAAERTLAAARAERLPSISVSGNYGVLGPDPTSMHGVFAVTGSLNIPIWQGGRTKADIEQAEAVVRQRRAELENQRSAVEQDVRTALIDLRTAEGQLELAQHNRAYAQETFTEARDRFNAGVATTVEVVQAQEQVAAAESDYISSLYSFNLAQLELAKAMGDTEAALLKFEKGGKE